MAHQTCWVSCVVESFCFFLDWWEGFGISKDFLSSRKKNGYRLLSPGDLDCLEKVWQCEKISKMGQKTWKIFFLVFEESFRDAQPKTPLNFRAKECKHGFATAYILRSSYFCSSISCVKAACEPSNLDMHDPWLSQIWPISHGLLTASVKKITVVQNCSEMLAWFKCKNLKSEQKLM